jgi:thiol-disulfide isomerase/thioredoxin
MKIVTGLMFSLLLTGFAFSDPTELQWAVVKKYDGMSFSTAGLQKLKTQDNGWTQYQWTEGRFLWQNVQDGSFAVEQPDGTSIYRYSAEEYSYQFSDGRQITTDPTTGAKSWSVLLGEAAPDFELKALDGTTVKLSALKGKVVLLDFWASWCPPCREYLPGTEAIYQKYKDQGLVVLGVNIEGDTEKARTAAGQLGLNFPILMALSGKRGADWGSVQVAQYGITGIPHAVLIDKKGLVRYADVVLEKPKMIGILLAE